MLDYFWPFQKNEKSFFKVGQASNEPTVCCPPSICTLLETVAEEYRVAILRGFLVWMIGATAWASSNMLALLQQSQVISIAPLGALVITLVVAFILGVIAYGILNVPVGPSEKAEQNYKESFYKIIQLGLLVGASLCLPAFTDFLYGTISQNSTAVPALSLAIVIAVMGAMIAAAYQLACLPCLCPIRCVPALVYAAAAISIGYNINSLKVSVVGSSLPTLFLIGMFFVLAVVILKQMILACVERICAPISIIFAVHSVSRALIAVISTTAAAGLPPGIVSPLSPILVPLVLLCGFWALWSLVRCNCAIVEARGIIDALTSSIVPSVLVFALPLNTEPDGLVAFAVVPTLLALIAVILLSRCVQRSDDCVALILMAASIGAYSYALVAVTTTFYEVFLNISQFATYRLTTNAFLFIVLGTVIATAFLFLGWPRCSPLTRTAAARSLVFSAVGAGPAVLLGSFAAFLNTSSTTPYLPSLIQAILQWLPIAGAAIYLTRTCCLAEVYGGIGVAFGSVAFAKAIGLYSVLKLDAAFSSLVISILLFILPSLVATGVALISGLLARVRCGSCPRDSLAAFATGLAIVPLSNVIEAICLGFDVTLVAIPASLLSVMPIYVVVALLAAIAALYFFAAPLFLCKDSQVSCCDAWAASPSFLAPAFLGGVLVTVVSASFVPDQASLIALLIPGWPSFAATVLFSGLVLGVFVPMAIRVFSGKALTCRPPAFRCTWPKDIITFAISSIFAGQYVFQERYRLGRTSGSILWNLIVRLQFIGSSAVDPTAIFFTVMFAWLIAPTILDVFLLLIDASEQLAHLLLIPADVVAACVGFGNSDELTLAIASAVALFALVFWQIGSESFFSQVIYFNVFTLITIFGWYLVLLSFLALIVLSAILLRFDSKAPCARLLFSYLG